MSSIVVADAGPLHYLVLIDCGETFGELFDHVLVPFAVRDELLHPRAPQKVKDWIVSAHPWLEITPVTHPRPVQGLHKGETEALQLALERHIVAVLLDDMDDLVGTGYHSGSHTPCAVTGVTLHSYRYALGRTCQEPRLELSAFSALKPDHLFAGHNNAIRLA